MEFNELKNIIEAALLAASSPMSTHRLAALFEESENVDNADIGRALDALAADCEGRGVELVEVASGHRYQVRREVNDWVAKLWTERPSRYSRALLETLALIAYRQPITRGEIEAVRGVSVSTSIVKTLEEREWIRVVGHRDVPGRPALFGTTREFLDYFNLKSLDELPSLAEIRDMEVFDPQLDLDGEGDTAPARAALPGDAKPVEANDAERVDATAADAPVETDCAERDIEAESARDDQRGDEGDDETVDEREAAFADKAEFEDELGDDVDAGPEDDSDDAFEDDQVSAAAIEAGVAIEPEGEPATQPEAGPADAREHEDADSVVTEAEAKAYDDMIAGGSQEPEAQPAAPGLAETHAPDAASGEEPNPAHADEAPASMADHDEPAHEDSEEKRA